MRKSFAIPALTILVSLLLPVSAHALVNTWFKDVVSPGTTRWESGSSTGFLRTSSNAESGLNSNPFTKMTCYLGNYSTVGGDTSSVSTIKLNNERAGFTYDCAYSAQEARVRAWIDGIPSNGGMQSIHTEVSETKKESSSLWSDGTWAVQYTREPQNIVKVSVVGSDIVATTTGSVERFESQGIPIRVSDGMREISLVVFEPSSNRFDAATLRDKRVELVAPGVLKRSVLDDEEFSVSILEEDSLWSQTVVY